MVILQTICTGIKTETLHFQKIKKIKNQAMSQAELIKTTQPINTTQPQMAIAKPIPDVLGGLEYLSQLDQLIIKQKVEILEIVTGMETANKYKIKNSMGQDVYSATEDSDFCERQFCGWDRGFKISIKDNHSGQEIISCERPFKCCGGCPCQPHEISIKSAVTGELLGKVVEDWHLIYPKFTVYDAADNPIFKMHGPFCNCCADVNFQIDDLNGTQVGLIKKQWSGLLKEAFTDADNFGVTFPVDLDVKMKAVMLGAVFLVDFVYFEYNA